MKLHFNPPIHPGEMLREEFLVPLGMSAGKLAKAINIPRTRIERLIREETALSTDTALRLARYFGMSNESWIGLQTSYELDRAAADAKMADALAAITPRETHKAA